LIVVPGSGAPDFMPLEAWRALTTARAFAAPGDPLAERLRENGYDVTELPEGRLEREAPPQEGLKGRNLLAPHQHGDLPQAATDLADRLAQLAIEHGEAAFISNDDVVTKAVMQRALAGDVEVEFVIGRAPRGHRLLELVKVMARLRGPGGCPWDAEQTHQTLATHLLDETYELLEAIETGTEADVAEELGDLLLQVVFHAQMGSDARAFDVDDVAQGLVDKLIRRHPHVFGDVTVSGAREVVENWDTIKEGEKARASVFEGIPESMPALMYAQKLQRRASTSGFDWSDVRGALKKVHEEIDELAAETETDAQERELGDLILALVALARHLDLDAETALRRAARTFRDRLTAVETIARQRGLNLRDLSDEDLDALWQDVKAR
jgi:MazG family protein